MGLFFSAPRTPAAPSSEGGASLNSRRMSPREIKEQVRRDLNDHLGHHKGEQIFNVLEANLDRDGGFGGRSVSGREVDTMIHELRENHRDTLHSGDIDRAKEILEKHLAD